MYSEIWSERAKNDLLKIVEYLYANWTPKEILSFLSKLERNIFLIKQAPKIFQSTAKRKNVRRCVITKQVSMFYRLNEQKKIIEIIRACLKFI